MRGLALERKRRGVSASALFVNPWVGGFRNDPPTSGGRIRTYDLRVMSPTSCQLLYPAITCRTVGYAAKAVKFALPGHPPRGVQQHTGLSLHSYCAKADIQGVSLCPPPNAVVGIAGRMLQNMKNRLHGIGVPNSSGHFRRALFMPPICP